ncbi:MAG TPA: LytTR family DNA-binding domain-containing protein [Thermoanaerobaculia bacterium]|nr:LytTR family DNA-binding domain-containing protein [Thermoanaerobaculia bacterium]
MIRVAVVDDEPPARRKLCTLLAREADVEVVGEAGSGPEAVGLLRATRPDLVFLDIQMPGLDGFEVLAELAPSERPQVVFVTAYDQHALRAFEVHAFDYLLKPFAPSRLAGVLERARSPAPAAREGGLEGRLERLLATLGEGRPTTRLLVERENGREILLTLERVDFVRAERNELTFHTRDGVFRRRGTLSELETRLDAERFLRINRSEIVRLDAVAELQPWFHGDYRVVLRGGTVLSWSRRYRARDKDRF